jgi:uncharacterized protein YbcV (DUF1398 family)
MDAHVRSVAAECTQAAEEDRMNFGEIVMTLTKAGVESYFADFRRAAKTYYLPDGESIEILAAKTDVQPAVQFNPAGIEAAVREAQANRPDYTYKAFCAKVMAAGCAGYIVSLVGRRAVYFGRTAECHVELFPPAG